MSDTVNGAWPEPTHVLLQAARSGERAALEALFAREWPRLRHLLRRHAGPALLQRVELDDLVQEACVEALRQLPAFEYHRRGAFFRWLVALALHRLQNLRRSGDAACRDRRREQCVGGPDGRMDLPAVEPGPGTLLSSAEGVDDVQAALASLSPIDRRVIALARTEGLPLAEVALRMGRSRNAVALLLSRALRKLAAQLARAHDAGAEPPMV
ncbi:MAG: sigma-70 family RNA polymerase sigma factor [Planctomycetota bacterium]